MSIFPTWLQFQLSDCEGKVVGPGGLFSAAMGSALASMPQPISVVHVDKPMTLRIENCEIYVRICRTDVFDSPFSDSFEVEYLEDSDTRSGGHRPHAGGYKGKTIFSPHLNNVPNRFVRESSSADLGDEMILDARK